MFRKLMTPQSMFVGLVAAFGFVVVVSATPQQAGTPQSLTVWAPYTVTPEKTDEALLAKMQRRGHGALEGHVDRALPDRCLRTTSDCIAQPQSRGEWAIKTMTVGA